MEQQQEPQFSREESANRISRLIAKISRVHCNCVNERLQPLGLTNLTSTHLIRDEPKRVGLPPVGEQGHGVQNFETAGTGRPYHPHS